MPKDCSDPKGAKQAIKNNPPEKNKEKEKECPLPEFELVELVEVVTRGGTEAPVNFVIPANIATFPAATQQQYYNWRINAIGSQHSGGSNACRADGSVSFLSSSISLTVLQALGSRAGGEVIPGDS